MSVFSTMLEEEYEIQCVLSAQIKYLKQKIDKISQCVNPTLDIDLDYPQTVYYYENRYCSEYVTEKDKQYYDLYDKKIYTTCLEYNQIPTDDYFPKYKCTETDVSIYLLYINDELKKIQ
jgi:hypothetical protein